MNITIDIASALDYFYHHCSELIVHCHLKPGNVLLDNGMIAHLGEFGVTKFLLEATSESSANQSSSNGIRGTVGYAALGKCIPNALLLPYFHQRLDFDSLLH